MADVFRIVTAEGHEHDFHGGVEQLKEAHPGAVITGRRVINEVGEGSYEPYTIAKAQAAKRKAAAEPESEDKPKRKAKRDEPSSDDTDEAPAAEPVVESIVIEAPAES